MKIWEKGSSLSADIEKFTVGNDRELDLRLASFDIIGTLAHSQMLHKIELITDEEWAALRKALLELHQLVIQEDFRLNPEVEDIHSHVEWWLTEQLGDIGRKVHSGRSRNDQVLLDIKLYLRDEIKALVGLLQDFNELLLSKAEQYQQVLIPGYTHLQAAMPSSFGLWFGAYAESLVDDLRIMRGAYDIVNQNPLGSAAGYGNSFPLDRNLTTELLGFNALHINSVAAQMSRGKTETSLSFSISAMASTLSKLAMDVCLYNSQNFGFITFPDHITTGSSIMPHKKNPDIFELVRGRCNVLQTLPSQLMALTTNLPSGYHRELQLTKELLFPAIKQLIQCLDISHKALSEVQINSEIMLDDRYRLTYSVENVNQKVLQGIPFREAYREVAREIQNGTFSPLTNIDHTHLGSIGNPGIALIRQKLEQVVSSFNFARYEQAFEKLMAQDNP